MTTNDHPPGFARLVLIHLRILVQEFPIAWIILGGHTAALPVAVLLAGDALSDPGPMGPAAMYGGLVSLAASVTILVAFFWPDAVWRSLPPGRRRVIDALPVTRRVHRMARVVAGLLLPLAMGASVIVTLALLRGSPAFASSPFPGMLEGGWGDALVSLLSLSGAYFLASAIALRFGRVFVGLLVLAAGAMALPYILLLVGSAEGARWIQSVLLFGHWAPGRVLTLASALDLSDLAPVLGWTALLLGLSVYWAGRHDSA